MQAPGAFGEYVSYVCFVLPILSTLGYQMNPASLTCPGSESPDLGCGVGVYVQVVAKVSVCHRALL